MLNSGSLEDRAVGDIIGDFFVPAYQRGYRWGKQEVVQLLDDIRASEGSTYFLQPVVVKSREDGSWELVDGQQRLTTLYLIFRYVRDTHFHSAPKNYSITYETRPGSKEYLDRLTEADADSNIDFFHLFQAYQFIEEWFAKFEHRTTHEAMRLYGYLGDSVKVLWYEAPAEVDPVDLFTRLNVGRIPLTDAELVKALLLSRTQAGVGQTDRALEIGAHWDDIERDLSEPAIWAFITGEAQEEPTRINLLLDTLAGGTRGRERPQFQTFEDLRSGIEEDPQRFWRSVVELHSLVLGWYEDRDLFHKIGYLIAIGRSFKNLHDLSQGKGRKAFEAALDEEIRSHLGLTTSELADLTYTSPKTGDVLLLMNVETVRRMKNSAERYSFEVHAAGEWSLEHIHAENAEVLNTVEQWTAWLMYHRVAVQDVPRLDEQRRDHLLALIDEVLASGVSQQSFSAVERQVADVFSLDDDTDPFEIHSLSNLALLGQRDNAALNNSVFEVKRRAIIERDKEGSYIPACTRNVFLKYYTESGSQQLHFWSSADRSAYLASIESTLASYLQSEEAEQ